APSVSSSPGEKFCVTCGAKIRSQAVVCPQCGCAQPGLDDAPGSRYSSSSENSNRVAAGICGILLGALGVHKFILGYTGAGIIMLLVSIFGALCYFLGPALMGIIGLIEGIVYLSMSDKDFDRIHGKRTRSWF